MMPVEVRFGAVVVETEEERAGAERLGPVLDRAFQLLGERLGQEPTARWEGVTEVVVEKIELDGLGMQQLLGPSGASLVADRLYAAFEREVRWR